MCRGGCENPCECCFSCWIGDTYEPNCYNCTINSLFMCIPRCSACMGCPTCLESREHAMVRRMRTQNSQQMGNMQMQNMQGPSMMPPIPNQMVNPGPMMMNPNTIRGPSPQTTTTTTVYYNTQQQPMNMAPIPATNMMYSPTMVRY
jgi:hypothetical protein